MTEKKTVRGTVIEALPGVKFLVRVSIQETQASKEHREAICTLSGKMMFHHITVGVGDIVDLVLPPTGDRGRIVKRY